MRRSRSTTFSTRTPQVDGHHLVLLEGGVELFPAMVSAMDKAVRSVQLESYIFHFSGSALRVAEALERAAQRGVLVRLVVDGVGTPHIPPEWVDRFSRAGVRWRVYAPLGRLGLLLPSRWRRLHRKLCVVDHSVGFCGGINIIDDLDDLALGPLSEPRLDFSLQVSGPLVSDMVRTMEALWGRLQAVHKARKREFKGAWRALRRTLPPGELTKALYASDGDTPPLPSDSTLKRRRLEADNTLSPVGVASAAAALLLRDNLSHRSNIERAYLQAIGEARHDIVIVNAYFVPGRKLRRALTLATSRGVRVRLLVQGRYENFFQFHAARPVHHTLVAAGIEIHEYEPSALHAKVAVIDQRWATVGSTNLDPLSLLLAREANVLTTDKRFASLLHARLDTVLVTSGQPINAVTLGQRPWRKRLLDRMAFVGMRVMLFVTGHRY